jgi:hypothetical protein
MVLEPITEYGIIRTCGPITIPRIPFVQWVQDFRVVARPGTCESAGFLFAHWPSQPPDIEAHVKGPELCPCEHVDSHKMEKPA